MKYYNIVNGDIELTPVGKQALDELGISLDELINYPDEKLCVEYWTGCNTYVDQALKNGKGVTWLSDCRIPYVCESDVWKETKVKGTNGGEAYGVYNTDGTTTADHAGRFPANLLVSDDVLNDGKTHNSVTRNGNQLDSNAFHGDNNWKRKENKYSDSGSFSRYFDLDAWFKSKLPEQAQLTYPYLIVPKPAKSEKNKYCENRHPTVKPLKLMSYLITMGSREGDVILDPFAGSGTTLEAARVLNRKFVGCELTEEYKDIIEARAGVSITSDPYRNVIEVTERNELTIEEMEASLTDDERDRYEGLLIEAPYEIFETVRMAYFMGKGLKV